jgi:hypothetical protein
MEGYFSTGQSPQRAVVPVEEEEEEEEEEEKEKKEEEEKKKKNIRHIIRLNRTAFNLQSNWT